MVKAILLNATTYQKIISNANIMQREKDKNSTKSSFCSQTSTQDKKSQK